MSPEIIDIEKVNYCYPGSPYVLKDINLKVNRGDLVVIRGESGAGKSTLLKLFNRFCDSTEGTIFFHNKDLKECGIEELRKTIIYLPQLPYVTEGTVEENLSFPFLFNAHKAKQFDPVAAKKWLDYFQLNISLKRDALKLSIGQRQRIALIRAILLEPEVLLLDEPGSALDVKNKLLIEQKIESLINSSNLTVIMATHSEVSFASSDRKTYTIAGGKLDEVR